MSDRANLVPHLEHNDRDDSSDHCNRDLDCDRNFNLNHNHGHDFELKRDNDGGRDRNLHGHHRGDEPAVNQYCITLRATQEQTDPAAVELKIKFTSAIILPAFYSTAANNLVLSLRHQLRSDSNVLQSTVALRTNTAIGHQEDYQLHGTLDGSDDMSDLVRRILQSLLVMMPQPGGEHTIWQQQQQLQPQKPGVTLWAEFTEAVAACTALNQGQQLYAVGHDGSALISIGADVGDGACGHETFLAALDRHNEARLRADAEARRSRAHTVLTVGALGALGALVAVPIIWLATGGAASGFAFLHEMMQV